MVIIDASIASKLFLPHEENRNQVKLIFEKHTNNIEKISVPDLLFYEVANALSTKTTIPKTKVAEALNQLSKYNLEVFYPSVDEIIRAADFAKDNRVSVYDAVYAVLAQDKGCDLVTADTKFVDQVNLPFVKIL